MTVMDHAIITLGAFVLILALLGIAAARFGVDSRHVRDDDANPRSLP